MAALVSGESSPQGPGRESLDQFLAQLPQLCWTDVLRWLQERPDITAKELFARLQQEQPERFPDGQLRTLQRRIREWRQVMARTLVYAGTDENNQSAAIGFIGAAST